MIDWNIEVILHLFSPQTKSINCKSSFLLFPINFFQAYLFHVNLNKLNMCAHVEDKEIIRKEMVHYKYALLHWNVMTSRLLILSQ